MNRLSFTIVIAILFLSCRKEKQESSSDSLQIRNVREYLKDSLSTADFQTVDFQRLSIAHYESEKHDYVRIPFNDTNDETDFIIIQTDEFGGNMIGRIVKLNRVNEVNEGFTINVFNGSVNVSYLNRRLLLNSPITNGYIEAFHPGSLNIAGINSRESVQVVPDKAQWLEEVLVIGYKSSSGISSGTWLQLNSMFSTPSNGAYANYSRLEPWSSASGTASGYNNAGSNGGGFNGSQNSWGVNYEDNVEVEYDPVAKEPVLDINKVFNCFDKIPSNGATYSIKLCADIPVNTDPYSSVNAPSGSSAGHTFLIVTKANGTQTVQQSFGFYPSVTPSWLDPLAVVKAGIKDNGGNEINGSIEMNVSEAEFKILKENAIAWSAKKYDLADYNCSNYAIDIFNSVRNTPLTISPISIPVGTADPYNPTKPITISINKSPQMLFLELQHLKNINAGEARNVRIDQSHAYRSPASHGECN